MLVKAMPNPSQKYGETVCCAGVTANGLWKRLYPVRFRHIEQKFNRWSWVEFKHRAPTGDRRVESCHVYEDSLKVGGELGVKERGELLNPLISPSTAEASLRGQSLTLVRPLNSQFQYKRKTASQLDAERAGYKRAARQTSFLDSELAALEPTPYIFAFAFEDANGRHLHRCGDWETSATYWKLARTYSEQAALNHLEKMYNEDYPSKGMVFAMGTVAARPKQWLLLGVLRLDPLSEAQIRQARFDF
jgi:hypothetical protein